jgi:hypothetical protein
VVSQLNLLHAHALQLHKGLERRLVLAMAPELPTSIWNRSLTTLPREFPTLEIEIRSTAQTDAVRMIHDGNVHVALMFERPGIDERGAFAEAGSQLLTAVAPPATLTPATASRRTRAHGRHPADRGGQWRYQGLGPADRSVTPGVTDRQLHVHLRLGAGRHGLGQLAHPMIDSGVLAAVKFDNMASQTENSSGIIFWLKISSRPFPTQLCPTASESRRPGLDLLAQQFQVAARAKAQGATFVPDHIDPQAALFAGCRPLHLIP